jgi:YfiH family protein
VEQTQDGYQRVAGEHGAEVLRSPLLARMPWLQHGFPTRLGGVSEGGFASLNFGLKGGDDPARVRVNLERLGRTLGFDPHRTFRVSQVHGRRVVVLDPRQTPPQVAGEQADALVSDQPGATVGVQTADCVPVLLADPRRRVVAAAHAGWRGIVAGVLQATVQQMTARFGCAPADLAAALGPAIGPAAYEVGPEVAEKFEALPGAVLADLGPRPHLDLFAAATLCLRRAGLAPGRITRPGVCTHSEPGRFFSYRRDGQATGHHLSVIGLVR